MSEAAHQQSPSNGGVRRRRLSALAEMNLLGKPTVEAVLDTIVGLATDLMPASLGASALVVEPDGSFRAVATTVRGQSLEDADGIVRTGGGATGHIRDSLAPVTVPDIAADPFGPNPEAERLGVKAYLGVPIAMDERCLGVLYVMDTSPREYAADEIEFLELLAGRTAAAVHHAGIFAEMRTARERSEALAWVAHAVIAAGGLTEVLEAVVDGIAAAVAADEAEIVTVDRDGNRVVHHARSGLGPVAPDAEPLDGPAFEAIRESRMVVSSPDDVPLVVSPLRVGDSVLGALAVRRGSRRFDEAEVDLIVAMANQVAIAIDNVRLLDTTRAALRETEAMYTMAQALVAGTDLPEILDAIAVGTVSALPADGARVVMADGDDAIAQAVAGVATAADRDAIDSGNVGAVLQSGAIIDQPHALVVPLSVHGRMLGALEAISAPDSAPFTKHQRDTLLVAAAQGAVAIENHLLFGEVQRLAITDELTGVNTRRHLFELGQREFAQSVRFRKPLSAMMFDLDHFKEINDSLGHLVGDEVLAGVAERCARVLREIDVLGRYGGEEFAVILPDAELSDAVTVAERVRTSVSDTPVETARGPVAVTVSVGVAEVGPGVHDLKTLLDRADAAMYAAKAAGRDQVQAA